jgi:hypothetical protein
LAVTSILKNRSRTQDRKLKMSYNPKPAAKVEACS